MGAREFQRRADEGPTFNILPIPGVGSEEARRGLVELQLKMATSSINHEYARLEFDDASDRERRDELMEYMNDCRREYFEARRLLSAYDSNALADFEADLWRQKLLTVGAMAEQ